VDQAWLGARLLPPPSKKNETSGGGCVPETVTLKNLLAAMLALTLLDKKQATLLQPETKEQAP
jgi:hypothetical protein